jgi:hypothetical protein
MINFKTEKEWVSKSGLNARIVSAVIPSAELPQSWFNFYVQLPKGLTPESFNKEDWGDLPTHGDISYERVEEDGHFWIGCDTCHYYNPDYHQKPDIRNVEWYTETLATGIKVLIDKQEIDEE